MIITNITLIVLMVAKVMFHPRVALTCHLPPPLTRGTDFLVIMMMYILVVMSMMVVMVVVLEVNMMLLIIFEVMLAKAERVMGG